MDNEKTDPVFVIEDNKISGVILSLVERLIINKNKSQVSSSFWTSKITKCPRRLIKDSNNTHVVNSVAYEYPYSFKWEECFKLSDSNLELITVNKEVSDWNYSLKGIVDFIVKFDDQPYCVMIKQLKKESDVTDVRQKKGFRNDIVELVSNMWLSEIENGILIYDGFNQTYILHVLPNNEIINAIKSKCQFLSDHKLLGKIPEKPYAKISKECEMCDYKKECWRL